MRRLMAVMVVAAFVAACGEVGEPEPEPGECVGEDCESLCEAEAEEELCAAAGAACGVVEVVDRCGETRAISCGGCGPQQLCENLVCAERAGRPVVDACAVIPAEGVCVGLRTLHRCTGSGGASQLVRETCASDERCVETVAGAACAPTPCKEGLQVCTPEGNLLSCTNGALVESPCADGCVLRVGQAGCREPLPESVLLRGRVYYEHRHSNDTLTGWAEPVFAPAAGLTVYFLRGGEITAWNTVEQDGSYDLLVPERAATNETLVFLAVTSFDGSDDALIGVVDPDLPPGQYPPAETGGRATWWSWTFADARADQVVIRENNGSGAVQVFQNLLMAAGKNAALGGLDLPPVAAIYAPGVDYDCLACFQGDGTGRGWISVSGGQSRVNRSDAALLHEAGHHTYHSLGPGTGEGGGHCLGVPAPPGQALSEGHASWYSADLRHDSILYSDHAGTFYHWDIGRRAPSEAFTPPRPEGGLDQEMNEAWVSAVLWDLTTRSGSGTPIHRALMAEEMRAPLASGYMGKFWWSVDASCRPVDPVPSGIETPILSDLLDAMVCDGFPAEVVSAVVVRAYPYEVEEPSCK